MSMPAVGAQEVKTIQEVTRVHNMKICFFIISSFFGIFLSCAELVVTIILVKQGKQSRVLLGDSIYNCTSMRVAERTLGGAHLAL